MSLSNVEYSSLKRKKGLHNWGGRQPRDIIEDEEQAIMAASIGESGHLRRYAHGEHYALEGLEE